MDETTCLVRSVARLAKFFQHESCGQCTPCREGTNWSAMVLARLEAGQGSADDRELILRMTNNMSGTALCPLADAAVGPLRSLAQSFPEEIEAHLGNGGCPYPVRRYFAPGATA
jgi:NADH-quinone oxidoreductase subunit F